MAFKKLCLCAIGALTVTTLPYTAAAKYLLPLAQGIFVDKRVKCTASDNSNTLSFWGNELNSTHVIGTIKKVIRQKQAFVVTLYQEGDEGMGGGLQATVNWTLFVRSPKEFSLGTDTYRWCFARMP